MWDVCDRNKTKFLAPLNLSCKYEINIFQFNIFVFFTFFAVSTIWTALCMQWRAIQSSSYSRGGDVSISPKATTWSVGGGGDHSSLGVF